MVKGDDGVGFVEFYCIGIGLQSANRVFSRNVLEELPAFIGEHFCLVIVASHLASTRSDVFRKESLMLEVDVDGIGEVFSVEERPDSHLDPALVLLDLKELDLVRPFHLVMLQDLPDVLSVSLLPNKE